MGKQTWARNRRRPRVLQTPDRERESRTVTPDALRRGDLVRNILVLGKTGTGKNVPPELSLRPGPARRGGSAEDREGNP